MKRKLNDITKAIEPVSVRGSLETEINGLSYDAFSVRPGDLFLATEGVNSDRHQYIQQVLARGITAVVHSKALQEYLPGVTYIRVHNVQQSMSPVSAEFFRRPSRNLYVIGVTGTN
jgi:UDP-N-acetylmuramoyl-L-alanyl-D-glutamate--2,6-diaminopimelate ligase